jgi:hypothetical protein
MLNSLLASVEASAGRTISMGDMAESVPDATGLAPWGWSQ